MVVPTMKDTGGPALVEVTTREKEGYVSVRLMFPSAPMVVTSPAGVPVNFKAPKGSTFGVDQMRLVMS